MQENGCEILKFMPGDVGITTLPLAALGTRGCAAGTERGHGDWVQLPKLGPWPL